VNPVVSRGGLSHWFLHGLVDSAGFSWMLLYFLNVHSIFVSLFDHVLSSACATSFQGRLGNGLGQFPIGYHGGLCWKMRDLLSLGWISIIDERKIIKKSFLILRRRMGDVVWLESSLWGHYEIDFYKQSFGQSGSRACLNVPHNDFEGDAASFTLFCISKPTFSEHP
jgi:hypothetical protein